MKADYDLISEDWATLRKTLPQKDNLLFEFFVENLPERAEVLDLGCGTGVPIAKLLSDNGFRVTGVDRSANLLDKARENVPAADFQRAEMEDYQMAGAYDGVVLWDALFHLPRAEHRPVLAKISGSLKPGGSLILSSGGSRESLPPFVDFMFGVPFFYDAYPVNEFIGICNAVGFTVARFEVLNEPDGDRDKGRIGVVLSKT
jgi:SAM-dependent methyltransferase